MWSRQFQTEKVEGDLGPIIASVHVIAQEENLVGRLVGATLKFAQHGHQVIELSVDVANDDDFAIDAQKIRLFR